MSDRCCYGKKVKCDKKEKDSIVYSVYLREREEKIKVNIAIIYI